MEGNSTNRARTADELRTLGASEDFIKAYFTEHDGRHSIVAELDPDMGGIGDVLIDDPDKEWRASIGGGYFKALWEDGASAAWGRADSNNRRILEKAGLVQTA
jgi:hypothetical protein